MERETSLTIEDSISDVQRLEIAMLLVTQEERGIGQALSVPSLTSISEAMSLPLSQVVDLFNEPSFLKMIRGVTKARAELALNGPGISRLEDIVANGKDKDALAAARLLGQLTGVLKTNNQTNVQLNFGDIFEKAQREKESSTNPMASIFDIKPAIEVD